MHGGVGCRALVGGAWYSLNDDVLLAPMITESSFDWHSERSSVLADLEPFATGCEHRRSHRVVHPIDDFLFDYYSLRPSQLRRWSPGPGVLLLDASRDELDHGR